MRCLFYFLLVFAVSIMPESVRADLYQWTDENGVVNFTDNPENIPPKFRKKTIKRSITVKEPEPEPSQPQDTTDISPKGGMEAEENAEPRFGGHDEQWWRSRYRELRSEIESIQDKLPEKKEELTELRHQYTVYTYPRNRIAYYNKLEEIEQGEARIKELKKQLEELDLKASRAAVPMDWRR